MGAYRRNVNHDILKVLASHVSQFAMLLVWVDPWLKTQYGDVWSRLHEKKLAAGETKKIEMRSKLGLK